LKNTDIWPWFLGAAGAGAAAIYFTDAGQNAINIVKTTAQSAVTTRTPQDIFDAVAAIDPEHNPELQPGANGGADWCNKFIYLVLTKLGVYMPINTLANAEVQYMLDSPDWTQVQADDAVAAALQGQVAVATYYNPTPGRSGHVALVLPIEGGVQIAQAGGHTYNQIPLAYGFGSYPVQFFVHA
jgi:hypothetical protein